MIKVKRLGHATIATPDLEAQIDYYSRLLGLSVIERSKDRVFLGSKQGLEAIELVQRQAERAEAAVVPDRARHRPRRRRQGARARWASRPSAAADISPGVAEAVTLRGPQGHADRSLRRVQVRQARRHRRSIFNILKLGHVAYRVLDVQQIVKFYCDVLGFRVSDWRGDFFVFMRCNTDHHTLNFIIDEKPQLHHIAFEVVDWSEIHKAVDYLAHNKVHLVWGPGRHIIGHNVATYHRNADLVRVEIFTEMDQMKDEELGYFDPRPWHQEFPLYPKMHGPETLRNYWGFGSERVIQGYQTNELPKYGAIRG